MSSSKQRKRRRIKREPEPPLPAFHYVIEQAWLHTHGMEAHGLPELEARGVPAYLAPAAIEHLGFICRGMLATNSRPPLDVAIKGAFDLPVRLVQAEPIPGEEAHYLSERWLVQDVQPACECCRPR